MQWVFNTLQVLDNKIFVVYFTCNLHPDNQSVFFLFSTQLPPSLKSTSVQPLMHLIKFSAAHKMSVFYWKGYQQPSPDFWLPETNTAFLNTQKYVHRRVHIHTSLCLFICVCLSIQNLEDECSLNICMKYSLTKKLSRKKWQCS